VKKQSFESVAKAFAKTRAVALEKGWGSDSLCLKVGGKIFAMTTGAGFVAKLPKARVDELVAAKLGKRFDPRKNGRVMKEWFVASERCDWVELAREAHAFVKKA
jgi:hypothetical protein